MKETWTLEIPCWILDIRATCASERNSPVCRAIPVGIPIILDYIDGFGGGHCIGGKPEVAEYATLGTERLQEQERVASAMLVAAIGAAPGTPTPVTEQNPPLILPAENDETLRAAAKDHPSVRALGLMAESRSYRAEAASAEAYPSFTLGLDYIETGPADMPGVDESSVDITLEKNVLTINGYVDFEQPEGYALAYAAVALRLLRDARIGRASCRAGV